MIDTVLITRIRKLMALTVERGASEAEAALASEHVQRMLAEHNLSMAAIEMAGGVGEAGSQRTRDQHKQRQVYKWQRTLMRAIADLNYCATIERYESRGRNRVFDGYDIIGRIDNVTTTRVMFDYLLETIERLARDDVKDPTLYFTRYAHSFKEGCADRLVARLADKQQQIVAEQERKAREAAAQARHPSSSSSNLPVLRLSDVIQQERDLNDDMRYGYVPGTTARKRAEREERNNKSEAARRQRFNDLKTVNPDLDDELLDAMSYGWSKERAEEFLGRNKKPETEAQKRKRAEREDRDNRKYWERREREQSRLDSHGYNKGYEAADDVSLDRQIDKNTRHRIG